MPFILGREEKLEEFKENIDDFTHIRNALDLYKSVLDKQYYDVLENFSNDSDFMWLGNSWIMLKNLEEGIEKKFDLLS